MRVPRPVSGSHPLVAVKPWEQQTVGWEGFHDPTTQLLDPTSTSFTTPTPTVPLPVPLPLPVPVKDVLSRYRAGFTKPTLGAPAARRCALTIDRRPATTGAEALVPDSRYTLPPTTVT